MNFQLRNPVHLLATGFGSGLAPKAPGTFGTLAAIPPWLLLSALDVWIYLAVCVLAFVAGVWICGRAASDMNSHDHPAIVYDEVVGYWITMIAVPAEWPWIVAGFILFRVFDIIKPWPISVLDRRVKAGFGIMIDDVVAGIFALAVLHSALWLFAR